MEWWENSEMHYCVPQLTLAVSLFSCPNQIHETALRLFILYIRHCQFEADAQMLRCLKWARCSDVVLLDFLMRVSPQIHPCLQSPGLACDSLCVAAELPIAHERITDCLNSYVLLLVQGSFLDQISDIQTLCIPPAQLEEPTLLAMAVAVESGLNDGPHNGPHCSEVAQFFFWLNKIWSVHYVICGHQWS